MRIVEFKCRDLIYIFSKGEIYIEAISNILEFL